MRKTLLALVLAGTAAAASAQCTPNQLYADSIYGVWPDTLENFNDGVLNQFYSDTLNLLVPTDAGLVNEAFAGFIIDSVAFDGVDNLPPGLSVICNSQTGAPCSYLTGNVGCGLIEGTPTAVGTYAMTLNVTAYTTLGIITLPVPQSFTGYSIEIAEDNTAIAEATFQEGSVRNTPNPFAGRTTITFDLNKAATARIKVFNLVGEELWRKSVDARRGTNTVPFEAANLQSGVYLYKVEVNGHSFTGRMVLDR